MLSLISLFLHLSQLLLHGAKAGLRLHERFLNRVFFLLFLALLVGQLLLEGLHLLLVFLLNGFGLLVALRVGKLATFVLLHAAHLRLDLVNSLRPGVLEKLTQVSLDLINVLLHGRQQLFFLFKTVSSIGLLD